MSRELILVCQECGGRIASDDGYLGVNTVEVNAAQRAVQAWEERQAQRRVQDLPADEVLSEYPTEVRWQAHHETCDPVRGRFRYRIPAADLRTPADLLGWTAYLMEKTWLARTDWPDILREARDGGRRIELVRCGH